MSQEPPKPKHDHSTLNFPDGFLWGAATSAYQVEGNNTNADWWEWERKNQPEEKWSGEAADQYHLYEKDFELIKDLGHNSHRLSLEWSRIEPEEGRWDESEIEHYKKVLKSLKDKDLKVMLTLNHMTIPIWLAKKGGYESFSFPKYFRRFVKKVVPEYKDYVDLWLTLNEPGSIAWMNYLFGLWPPGKRSLISCFKAYFNMARAHRQSYRIIHQIIPNAQVGITTNINSFHPLHNHKLLELISVWGSDLISNHLFIFLSGKRNHDFFGLDYYFNSYINSKGGKFPQRIDIFQTKKDVTDMGWEIYPQGMFEVIMDFSDYKKPIYIAEAGIASTNDDRRCRFLIGYLQEIYHAISTGADVKGFFHWSLIDNFEWADGYTPRFGLIEVDYKTQKRTPRLSAYLYKEIIKHNGIPHELLKFIGHSVNAEEVLKEVRE